MARGKLLFKERDLRRFVRGVQKLGIPMQRAEIDRDGRIVVVVGPPEDRECSETTERNEWDAALKAS